MNKKIYWGLAILIVLLIGVSAVLLMRTTDTEPTTVYKGDVESSMKPPPAEPGFKWVWHHNHWDRVPVAQEGELPSNPIEVSTSDWTPAQVQISKDITDPDVKAAWERLEDISKNRHKWGQFSPRALELMDELTPMPSTFTESTNEYLIEVLGELASFRDPRSAELLVNYQIDSAVWGRPIDEALVAMGPASVPALITGLKPERAGEVRLYVPMYLLSRIVETYRSELGGIVEHIIIPKLKVFAASENPGSCEMSNKRNAIKALGRLQKSKGQ